MQHNAKVNACWKGPKLCNIKCTEYMVNWKLRTWQTCGVEENYVEWFICLWYVVIYHCNRYVLHPLSKIKDQHWVITQWSEVSRWCVTILKTILHCGDKVSRPSSQNGEIGHTPFLHPLNHRLYKTLQRKNKFRNYFNIVTVSSYITIIYHIIKFNNKTDTDFKQSLLPLKSPIFWTVSHNCGFISQHDFIFNCNITSQNYYILISHNMNLCHTMTLFYCLQFFFFNWEAETGSTVWKPVSAIE